MQLFLSFLSLTALLCQYFTLATPIPVSSSTGTSANVLTASSYNDFQISSGIAGNASAEVLALMPIDRNNLAGVSADDLNVIKGIHDAAEDAETDAFDPAIDAASGDAATALQVSWCEIQEAEI